MLPIRPLEMIGVEMGAIMTDQTAVSALFRVYLAVTRSTVSEFASEIGYSASAVQNVLAGRRRSEAIESEICARLKHDVNELFPVNRPVERRVS